MKSVWRPCSVQAQSGAHNAKGRFATWKDREGQRRERVQRDHPPPLIPGCATVWHYSYLCTHVNSALLGYCRRQRSSSARLPWQHSIIEWTASLIVAMLRPPWKLRQFLTLCGQRRRQLWGSGHVPPRFPAIFPFTLELHKIWQWLGVVISQTFYTIYSLWRQLL